MLVTTSGRGVFDRIGGAQAAFGGVLPDLVQHPAVADAVVIGVPDQRWTEAVKAIVVFREGAEKDLDALDAYCREHSAAYKRPRWYEVTESIPRSATNKALKSVLRARHDPATSTRLQETS